MEECERNHIRKCLSGLVNETLCTTTFLSILIEKEVLSREDVSQIASSGCRFQQSFKLYEIVVTRKYAFQVLLAALKKTLQSGAHELLNSFDANQLLASSPGHTRFEKHALFGKGGSLAKVCRGKFGERVVTAVVKKVVHSKAIIPIRVAVALREATFLLKYRHENIATLFGAQMKEKRFRIVALKLCSTNLREWVHYIYAAETASPDTEVDILRQMTSGVEYLHNALQIMHGNISPDSILVILLSEARVRVRLTDSLSDEVGTEGWTAPEIQQQYPNGDCLKTTAMDMFSLGCVFYFVLSSGCHPLGNNSNSIRTERVDFGPLTDSPVGIIKPQHAPSTLLINLMISSEPPRRPSTKTVLSHPFLWSSERKMRFVSLIYSCVDKVEFADCFEQLESRRHYVFGGKGVEWLDHFSSEVKDIFVRKYGFSNRMVDLLGAINLFSVQPQPEDISKLVENFVGSSAGQNIFLIKFPFLLDYLWATFQNYKEQMNLCSFYGENAQDDICIDSLEAMDPTSNKYYKNSIILSRLEFPSYQIFKIFKKHQIHAFLLVCILATTNLLDLSNYSHLRINYKIISYSMFFLFARAHYSDQTVCYLVALKYVSIILMYSHSQSYSDLKGLVGVSMGGCFALLLVIALYATTSTVIVVGRNVVKVGYIIRRSIFGGTAPGVLIMELGAKLLLMVRDYVMWSSFCFALLLSVDMLFSKIQYQPGPQLKNDLAPYCCYFGQVLCIYVSRCVYKESWFSALLSAYLILYNVAFVVVDLETHFNKWRWF